MLRRCVIRQAAYSAITPKISAMNRKNPAGPIAPIIQPVTIGPEIAPTPLMKINPAEAAAMSALSR